MGCAEIQSTEGTTQGDNLAMSFYAIATVQIQQLLRISVPDDESWKLSQNLLFVLQKRLLNSAVSSKILVKEWERQPLNYWDKLGVNKTIREAISEFYKIPFISTPKNTFFQNKKITELINTSRFKEVENVPCIANPLSVSKKSDNLRLILDLRHVNMHVYQDKIKFEN